MCQPHLFVHRDAHFHILKQICTRKQNSKFVAKYVCRSITSSLVQQVLNPVSRKGLSLAPHRHCTVWTWLLGSNHSHEVPPKGTSCILMQLPPGGAQVQSQFRCSFCCDRPRTWLSFTGFHLPILKHTHKKYKCMYVYVHTFFSGEMRITKKCNLN